MSETIIDTKITIGKLRGTILQIGEALVMPTYHPAYILRNPSAREIVVRDIKMIEKAEISE
jgi:uracil-DNA glycosylase family 4